MSKKETVQQDNSSAKAALARTINELGLGSGANADEVISTFQTKWTEANIETQIRQLAPVISGFAPKIAEMQFYNRDSAYKGKIKGVLDDMYDKDLLYGSGREVSLPNFIPVSDFNANTFVPTSTTTPVNTISKIYIDQPKQVNLTLTPNLYLPVLNNAGNADAFIRSLRSTMTASLDSYLETHLLEEWVLKESKNVSEITFQDRTGQATTVPTNRVSKYTDTTSANTKECIRQVAWLVQKMTSTASNYFNIAGTNSNSFFVSDMDDIKILCTNKFLQNVHYGLSTGLFKPELLAPVIDKLVAVPDHKVVMPATTNTSATIEPWTNKLADNDLIIINTRNSFKFGKQYKNTTSQYYAMNQALQITINYMPYFASLKNGQMLVYSCANLNTLPGNPMGNVL